MHLYVLCVTLVPKPEERLNRSAIQNSSPPLNQLFGRVDVSFPVKYLKSQIISQNKSIPGTALITMIHTFQFKCSSKI